MLRSRYREEVDWTSDLAGAAMHVVLAVSAVIILGLAIWLAVVITRGNHD